MRYFLLAMATVFFVGCANTPSSEVLEESPTIDQEVQVPTDQEIVGNIAAEYENPHSDLIQIDSPTPGATISSPLTVSGQARGYWFFEASAPVLVTDWDGLIIGQGYVTAQGEWMTEDFVPFTGEIEFTVPAETPYRRGTLIFERHNASDLPENDMAVEMPVLFE